MSKPRMKYSKSLFAKKEAQKSLSTKVAKVTRDVKEIKSMIELKVQDTNIPLQNIPTTPVVALLNGLLRGDDYNQRNGRVVKFNSIYQRLTCQSVATATLPHYIRYVLFWVKDAQAAAPTPLQMFGAAAPGINVMMNLNVRKDFIILVDDIMKLQPVNGGNSSNFKKYYKKTSQQTVFNATNTGLITDIEAGALYCFIWSDTNTAGEQPQFTLQSRLRFNDA